MSIKRIHYQTNTSYFITFTCVEWIPLIAISDCYYAFYRWFEYLSKKGIPLLAYVIMPNHFHGIIHLPTRSKSTINAIVGNGKRFIAYEIIKILEDKNDTTLLNKLHLMVSNSNKVKGQKHSVFISSFDYKEIYSHEMLLTKLEYIHANPVQGKWNLVEEYTDYPHSSAAFYEFDKPSPHLSHYAEVFGR